MIRRLFRIVNRGWQGMHEAAILLGIFSLVSQLMGLFRDRTLAHMIGPSRTLDIYYAAFQVPNFIYISVASLASITVLMPFMIRHMDESGKESARTFFNEVLSGFLLLLVVVSAIVFFLMPRLAHFIAPGFSPEDIRTLTWVSRIMLLSPIFLGLSSLLGTVTQLLRKFFIFSLSPIFYNLGIIFGVVFMYPRFGVQGLAVGVALGAMLHFLVQVPTIVSAGFAPKLSTRLKQSTLKQIAALSLPRTLGISMNSIALLVIIAIGSTLGDGAISIFNFSLNLETVPVGVIGISYAVASFPLFSEAFSRGNMKAWEKHIFSAVRQVIFWSLPISALFIVMRAQIVRVTLGTGAFSWTDTKLTAACFALFTVGMIGQNMIHVSVRAFYSAHDTKRPLYINIFCSVFIVLTALGLTHFFNSTPAFREFIERLLRVENTPGTGVLMLPLAYSFGTLMNASLHWRDLRRKYLSSGGGMGKAFLQSFLAAIALGAASYGVLNLLSPYTELKTFWGVFIDGAAASISGVVVAIGVLYFLRNEQLLELISAFRQKFWKADLVDPDKQPEEY